VQQGKVSMNVWIIAQYFQLSFVVFASLFAPIVLLSSKVSKATPLIAKITLIVSKHFSITVFITSEAMHFWKLKIEACVCIVVTKFASYYFSGNLQCHEEIEN